MTLCLGEILAQLHIPFIWFLYLTLKLLLNKAMVSFPIKQEQMGKYFHKSDLLITNLKCRFQVHFLDLLFSAKIDLDKKHSNHLICG